MRHLTLKKLWLISEQEKSAREIDLSNRKTLLLGVNGTGKSRVTKNIFWALGCEPNKRNAGSFDPDTISILEFEFNNDSYQAIRLGKIQGLYKNEILIFSETNHAAWSNFTSKLFNFELTAKRPKTNTYRPVGIDYLSVPFYIDQDGSWGIDWSPFTNLSQFSDWKPNLFAAFTGLSPNAYLEAKNRKNETEAILKEKFKEIDAQRSAFKQVKETLPKNLPSLDLKTFKIELNELGKKIKSLQKRQIDLKASLINVINQRQQLLSEIKLAVHSYNELVQDIQFISNIPDSGQIECPTCGTQHQNSFHARLTLSTDAESMSSLVHQLNKELENVRQKEASFRHELSIVEKEIRSFERITQEKKGRLKLDEILAAHSKKTLDKAFTLATESLLKKTEILESQLFQLKVTLKKFEDKDRAKKIREYYAAQLKYLSDQLNIPQEERVDDTKLGARPNSGGSSGPRAILAVHLALIATNLEFGDTVNFPFIVDTPQQSGQDEENLTRMITVMESFPGINQLVLAIERLPAGVDTSKFKVIELKEKRQLIKKENYSEIAEKFGEKIRFLKHKSSIEETKYIPFNEFGSPENS
jgi:hypothetical protein